MNDGSLNVVTFSFANNQTDDSMLYMQDGDVNLTLVQLVMICLI